MIGCVYMILVDGSISWGGACWGVCVSGVKVGRGVGVGVKEVGGGCWGWVLGFKLEDVEMGGSCLWCVGVPESSVHTAIMEFEGWY